MSETQDASGRKLTTLAMSAMVGRGIGLNASKSRAGSAIDFVFFGKKSKTMLSSRAGCEKQTSS